MMTKRERLMIGYAVIVMTVMMQSCLQKGPNGKELDFSLDMHKCVVENETRIGYELCKKTTLTKYNIDAGKE
jgi:hypothetical protein